MGTYREGLVRPRSIDRVELHESPLAAWVNHRKPDIASGSLAPVESPLCTQVNQVHARLARRYPAAADSPLAALINRRVFAGTVPRSLSDKSPLWVQVNSR